MCSQILLPVMFPDSYHNQLYEAVLLAITRSLVTLAESAGCQGEAIRAASALSNHSISRSQEPADDVQSPVASRAASAVGSEISRPRSILSMLSNLSWTTEKTEEVTYLQ